MLKASQKISFYLFLGLSLSASAEPVAVVEDVKSTSAKLEVMDFLMPGQTITLATGDTIVLGYMQPCLRETIKGGQVTIGQHHSKVNGGSLTSEYIECSGTQTNLDGQVGAQSGAVAYRAGPAGLGKVDIELFGTSPVFILEKPGKTVTITRQDKPETPTTLTIKGKYIDTYEQQLHLSKGGIYKVEAPGEVYKLFKVDHYASDKPVAVISRMVRLP